MTKMVRIDKLVIDAPFFQAGLAGYSDAAMRLVARRHGCPYAITEAMLDHFLIRGGKGLKHAQLDDADHPIAGQLMGSHPEEIAQASKILVGLGYDVVDINLACPVKKIRKKSRGGHLLQAPSEAIDILKAVRQAVPDHVPCTVKLRRGSDDSPQAEANFFKIFEATLDLGYAAATVHGRTVEQKYLGPSKWSFLRDLVVQYGQVENFAIFGSGDIWHATDIFEMIRQTNVQAVSVARGCIGNPWIFTQARALSQGEAPASLCQPTLEQQRRVLLDHFELSVALHGERTAGMMMRKFGIKFSRHHPDSESVAKAFITVQTLAQWRSVLEKHYQVEDSATCCVN